ncbi:MAG: glycosyltransferase [Alphaproteobacteria bacterium]|nr:glycosyltransferase [Alphaproteobacteria bacterium]
MSQDPSVAIVTGSLSSRAGGLYQSVRLPANRMVEKGVRLSVHGVEDDRWPDARSDWRVAELTAYRTLGPARFGYAPGMAQGIERALPDVLHLHGIWGYPSLAARRWRRRTARPLVIAPRGMLDPWALGNSAMRKRLAGRLFERENLAGASALHALCRAEADAMRAFGLRNPIAIIPNGVDIPDVGRLGRRPAQGPRRLLFLGRIHPKKGLSELLQAWRRVCDEQPCLASDWRLDIAGWDDGGHEAALRALAARLNLGDRVRFLGALYGEEKEAALRDAAAFVLPSYSEGLPMAVLEAWAWGLPVFMTAACNLPEGFRAGAAVRVGTSPAGIAAQLTEWLPRGNDLIETGLRGRMLAETVFSWDEVVDKQLRLFAWLVHGGPAPEFVALV